MLSIAQRGGFVRELFNPALMFAVTFGRHHVRPPLIQRNALNLSDGGAGARGSLRNRAGCRRAWWWRRAIGASGREKKEQERNCHCGNRRVPTAFHGSPDRCCVLRMRTRTARGDDVVHTVIEMRRGRSLFAQSGALIRIQSRSVLRLGRPWGAPADVNQRTVTGNCTGPRRVRPARITIGPLRLIRGKRSARPWNARVSSIRANGEPRQ